MSKKKTVNAIMYIVLGLVALIIMIPIYMVVINSVKSRTEAAFMNIHFPTEWHVMENYCEMFQEGGVLRGFLNSMMITLICSVALIMLCSAVAFVLQRKKSFLASTINMVVIIGLVMPIQIIPTYFVCNFFHLPNVIAGMLVLIVVNMPFTIFLYAGNIKAIPREIDESAWLDGANHTQLFYKLIFPLLRPATATAFIVNFMAVWNDFGNSIYFFNSAQNYTLPLTVYNFIGTHSSDWNLLFANVVVATLPVAVVYLILQRYIIDGMTAGAVKG